MDSVDYVTKRKYRKNKSANNSPNGSFLSMKSDSSTRSLPDLSTACYDLEELQNSYKTLQEQLESANLEIEQLILDNNKLKNKITELEKKIKILNSIYSNPRSSRKKQKHSYPPLLEMKKIDFDDDLDIENIFLENSTIHNTHNTYNTNTCEKDMNINNSKISIENVSEVLPRKRLFIFGGKQCVGLASQLISSRENSPYENYDIVAFTKPFACTNEILKACYNIKLNDSDHFIICVGEHDTNPTKVILETSAILKYLSNHKVYVLSVSKNMYLNETKLNNTIKLLCNNSPKCYYINYYNYNFISKKQILQRISYIINYNLDCQYYYDNFLIRNDWPLKVIIRKTHLSKKTEISDVNLPKKGTIPFYFKKTEPCLSDNSLISNTNKNKEFFRS